MASGYFSYPSVTASGGPAGANARVPVPKLDIPKINNPDVAARGPNAGARTALSRQADASVKNYKLGLGMDKQAAMAQLSGYGGWGFRDDDPSTPDVDESLEIKYNPNSGAGQREVTAVKQSRSAANKNNMLHSSFAQKNVGAALQAVKEEARDIAINYSRNILERGGMLQTQLNDIIGKHTDLLGADARWIAENPMPGAVKTPAAKAAPAKMMNYQEYLKKHWKDGRSTFVRANAYRRYRGLPPLTRKDK